MRVLPLCTHEGGGKKKKEGGGGTLPPSFRSERGRIKVFSRAGFPRTIDRFGKEEKGGGEDVFASCVLREKKKKRGGGGSVAVCFVACR